MFDKYIYKFLDKVMEWSGKINALNHIGHGLNTKYIEIYRKEDMKETGRTRDKVVSVMNRLTDKKSLSSVHRITPRDYWVENWINWICRKYERILK